MTKICSSCKTIKKIISEFSKDKSRKDGLYPKCKQCVNSYYKKNAEQIKNKINNYYKINATQINKKRRCNRIADGKVVEQEKAYRLNNVEHIRIIKKNWRKNNLDIIKKQKEEYNKINRQKIKKQQNRRSKQRKQEDLCYKIACNLRTRLVIAIKNNQKAGSAIDDLGCSVDEFRIHIEKQFQLGMSWDNYGLYGWHLDHIIPLSSFDLTNREQLLQACHYTNYQPLWAIDNLRKSNKIEDAK